MLRDKYGELQSLNEAWNHNAGAWEDLSAPAKLNDVIRADFSAFVKEHARAYFSTVRRELKALDPDHLYLGSRFAWFTQEAAEACAEFCDVISFNVYQRRIAPASWTFLEALDRPAIIGEFHFGALDRGMFQTGLQAAVSQQERAQFYQEYVASVLAHPSFVGCHWFQAFDQPLTGRTRDGENYNIGLVDITDTPYPELIQAAREIHSQVYSARSKRE
ncbi:MAG: beta-galactosidase [Bryobacteraceae bacterium]|nr:beta-galactosidase [Bryobacteraceae bacterium]